MKFTFKPSPNYRTNQSTSGIMRDVALGLLAVTVFSVIYYSMHYGTQYGLRIIIMMVIAVVSALATEALYFKATKQDVKKGLMGSYGWITAMILVLISNVNVSYYAICFSTVTAIFFGKLVFGGFGQNIFNPAAFGEAIVMTAFGASVISDFTTGATPATAMGSAGWMMSSSSAVASFAGNYGGILNMFLGNYTSTIGSTSAILLLIVFAFLVWRKDIDWRMPVFYVGTSFVLALVIGMMHGAGAMYPVLYILTGGIMFGAVFMITDPVTTPISIPGRIVYAVGAACLTMIIRYKSNLADGVLYSILLMNMLTPAIDKMMDGNQIKDAAKLRNNLLIVSACSIAVVLLVGITVTPTEASSSQGTGSGTAETGGTASAGTPIALSDDYADYKAECTESSNDGTTAVYACTARGFGLIDPDGIATATGHEYARNEAEITVDIAGKKITSYKLTVFGDTADIGDKATTDDALAQYADKTIDDSVDATTGATYTSKSMAAMGAAALNAAAGN